jgi:hypothetical protein
LGLDRSIEETLKTLDKLVVSPEELAHWCDVLESAARDNCKIMRLKSNSITVPTKNQLNLLSRIQNQEIV